MRISEWSSDVCTSGLPACRTPPSPRWRWHARRRPGRGQGFGLSAPLPPMTIRRLTADDLPLMDGLLDVFGEAFGEPETYGGARPPAAYQIGRAARRERGCPDV